MFVSSFLIVFVVLFVAWVVGHHNSVPSISSTAGGVSPNESPEPAS